MSEKDFEMYTDANTLSTRKGGFETAPIGGARWKGRPAGHWKDVHSPPPFQLFFLYVNPRSPRVPVFSARYLYVEPLYYGQILFNVLVGGRTAGAEIKMRKQSAPAVEVLIQKLTTVCWLIAFCLMCFQKPWFLFSVTQSQLRRDIKRPVKLKIPFKGAALPPPSSHHHRRRRRHQFFSRLSGHNGLMCWITKMVTLDTCYCGLARHR